MRITEMALVFFLVLASPARASGQDAAHLDSMQWVEYYARANQVPVELVEAMIEVESNWQPDAVSSKGAVGLMQLMPATAVHFGVRNRFRIEENVRAGVEYLACLMRLFRGDLRLAVAAYYTGEQPILARGLAYSSPDVYRYVVHVARLYRSKRLASVSVVFSGRSQN